MKKEPPVFNTVAYKKEGISELFNGIESHLKMIKKDGAFKKRRIERSRKRVIEIIKNNLEDSFWTKDKKIFS